MKKAPVYVVLLIATCLPFEPRAVAGERACPATQKFAEGVASTGAWDWRVTFVPSGRQMYWARTGTFWPATRERAAIQTAHRAGRSWAAPEVASFSGVHSDIDPALSPNGRYLVFSSERPRPDGKATQMDLWRVERNGNDWGEPVHLGDTVNSAGDELYASVDRSGALYFASNRDGEFDIYRSTPVSGGGYAAAEKLPGLVNTAQRWEFNPEISPDGRTVLFVRLDLPDALPDQGYGLGDIYVSRLGADGFDEPVNLGPCVNSKQDEFHPTVMWQRKRLFFARNLGVNSDFYALPLDLPR